VSFVLDASTALAWCFRDENDALASHALDRLESEEAWVPAIWSLEVANGLLTAERRKRISASESSTVMRLLLSLPIIADPTERGRDFDVVWRIARTHKLSSYDAAYIELAIRMNVPLITLDESLRAAGKREGLPAA
jgi:predicted nucleic acid-binding protein